MGILTLGKFIWDGMPEEIKDALKNAAEDQAYKLIAGKKTIDEWCKILTNSIDEIKPKIIGNENLQYIGGILCFQQSSNPDNITISVQLYFLNEYKEWEKFDSVQDLPKCNFTLDALEEIQSQGKLEFDVEE